MSCDSPPQPLLQPPTRASCQTKTHSHWLNETASGWICEHVRWFHKLTTTKSEGSRRTEQCWDMRSTSPCTKHQKSIRAFYEARHKSITCSAADRVRFRLLNKIERINRWFAKFGHDVFVLIMNLIVSQKIISATTPLYRLYNLVLGSAARKNNGGACATTTPDLNHHHRIQLVIFKIPKHETRKIRTRGAEKMSHVELRSGV
jgi:hypothetical protein